MRGGEPEPAAAGDDARMDVVVDLDPSIDTTTVSVHLRPDGTFLVRCSPLVDVEALLVLNREVAQRVVDSITG
jgi:hypothetical protein